MNFIDTHIHLQDYKSKSAPQIIAEAQRIGLQKLVCVSENEADWLRVAKLHEQFPDIIIPAFGIHPWQLAELRHGWSERLEENLQKYPNAWVGETGLDRLKDENFEPQNEVFLEHIRLAKQYHRPISIHAVKAQEWLQEYWHLLPERSIMHSFSGSFELMKQALKAGVYISLSNSVLKSSHFEEVGKAIPAERLLLETDGPYQGPIKGEETPLESILEIINRLAVLREEKPEILTAQIYQNSMELINGK